MKGATLRASIYARMSTDKQSADSPADQIARCREFAKRKGWQVVEVLVVEEPAVAGGSLANRPGLMGLLGRLSDFDVFLCWDFLRLSRDSGDLGWIRKAQAALAGERPSWLTN